MNALEFTLKKAKGFHEITKQLQFTPVIRIAFFFCMVLSSISCVINGKKRKNNFPQNKKNVIVD